jgi:tRNA A-37 threonylcarbamoyl transferase component Bud32
MKLDNIIAVRAQKTVYRDGDLAIKVFNENFSKSDILNEALNQARVEETGLNVPKLIEVSKIDGKWAIISEFIEGKTLEALMKENPDKFDQYLNQFVDIQLEMHSKKAPKLNKLKDKMTGKINQSSLDATTRYDLHTRLASLPTHDKLCHGDFNPSNIIIKPRRHAVYPRLVTRHTG